MPAGGPEGRRAVGAAVVAGAGRDRVGQCQHWLSSIALPDWPPTCIPQSNGLTPAACAGTHLPPLGSSCLRSVATRMHCSSDCLRGRTRDVLLGCFADLSFDRKTMCQRHKRLAGVSTRPLLTVVGQERLLKGPATTDVHGRAGAQEVLISTHTRFRQQRRTENQPGQA